VNSYPSGIAKSKKWIPDPETEFKEFEPRLEFKPLLKYG